MKVTRRHFWDSAPVILLLVLFGILLVGARALSLTTDEPLHIAVGYTVLARGKDALWLLPTHGHPPLLNVLEAVLVYVEKPNLPVEQFPGWTEHDYTKYTQAFILQLFPTERIELISRFPTILMTLLLAGLVYRWGRELWGNRAGLIGLFVLCFDPNLLAHGRLATTDVGAVALGTLALYFTWRWTIFPSWGKTVAIGLCAGLTMMAKMNGLVWIAAIELLMLFRMFQKPARHHSILLAQSISAMALSFLLLWAGHGFGWGPVQGLPGKYPAPEFWNGLILQAEFGRNLLTFAWGTTKIGSRWWYFPFAFFLKNPLPLLCASGIAVANFLRSPIPFNRSCFVNVAAFPILYTLVAIVGGMNIGYRHLLPIHPFIYLLVGGGINRLWRTGVNKNWKWGLILLGTWYVGKTLWAFPYEIAYFNEIIGGPYNGHHYLVDSNLDWGQSLKALRHWLNDHREWQDEPLYAIGSNPALYTLYGISSHPYRWVDASLLYARFAPPHGLHVIGASALQGMGVGEPDNFDWFRHRKPIARPGIALFVYHVPPVDPPPTWLAQCTVPVVPLSPQAAADGFGRNDLRMALFDCSSGWLYPTGGRDPGWFALFRETALSRDPFIRDHLAKGRLSFEQRRTGFLPPFAIYEQPAGPLLPRFPASERIRTGQLAFLGYNMRGPSHPDRLIEIETWWRVESVPSRPLSIMMHLVGPDGTRIVGDGLAIPIDQWQPGDIIVQRHRLPLPANAPAGEYQPFTGVYWLDTLERWTVMQGEQPAGDQIPIPPLQVR